MSSRVCSIVATDAHVYAVIVDSNGTRHAMTCRVVGDDALRVVQAEPDLMCAVGVPPRFIAAAVLAVDRARTDE